MFGPNRNIRTSAGRRPTVAWLAVTALCLTVAPMSIGSQIASAPQRDARAPAPPVRRRIPPLDEASWTGVHRRLVAAYAPDGIADNALRTWLNDPDLVEGVMPFLRYTSRESTLEPRHREMLIMRTAWLCRSEYVWADHAPQARAAGLTAKEILRVAEGPDAGGWSRFEAMLLRLADELYRNATVSASVWSVTAARYSTQQMMDAVFTVANFTMLSMTLNSIGVERDRHRTDRLPQSVPRRVVVPPREPPLAAARIRPLAPSEWTPEIRALLDPANSGRTDVLAISRTIANHPALYKPREALPNYINRRSRLAPRFREMLILRIGWLCRSEYEWAQHVGRVGRARELGLDPVNVAVGPDAADWDAFDTALLRAADELYRNDVIGDATWGTLAERFDVAQMLSVPITVGGYRMVSMALNAFGVQLEPGDERFPSLPDR